MKRTKSGRCWADGFSPVEYEGKGSSILKAGEKVHFTKLIYALGSECFIRLSGEAICREVAAVRRLADVKKVENLIGASSGAV